eukprot:823120-Amphidinium_carterae.1
MLSIAKTTFCEDNARCQMAFATMTAKVSACAMTCTGASTRHELNSSTGSDHQGSTRCLTTFWSPLSSMLSSADAS